jgi:hypothetical protein
MRVSVYLLRDKGARIPREHVRAAAPISGFLRVTREPGGRLGEWSRTAMLMAEDGGTTVLMQLHDVQLQLWDARGVVIAGTEIHWDRKQRASYRQSWFVVFPREAEQPAGPPRQAAPSRPPGQEWRAL